jgi:hypothetical protein
MRTALFIVMMFCQAAHALGQNGGGMSANELAGTTWRIDNLLGLDTIVSIYVLRPYESEDGNRKILGLFVSFDENASSYESRSKAWCGNDCFTIVNGQYEARASHLLRISVHQVRQEGGECWQPVNEQRPPNSTLFQMTFQSDTLLLTKVN